MTDIQIRMRIKQILAMNILIVNYEKAREEVNRLQEMLNG